MMSKMPRQNKLLLVTFLCTAFLQMPFVALNPVIDYMQKNIFPDRTPAEVQMAVALLNIFVSAFALLSAFVVARRWISKKAVVVTGLFVFGATGLAVVMLHTQYWHLWVLSVLIGAGSGMFISPMTSILIDSFSEKEMRLASGLQASVVNVGGIVFGVLGGILATAVWYGGYLLELLGLPIAVLALWAIPAGKGAVPSPDRKPKTKRSGLPAVVFYYASATFIFFMLYMFGGFNLSAHLSNAGFESPAVAGLASAVQMVGGIAAGLLFTRLSSKLGELILPVSFASLFIGYTILNLGQAYLGLNLLGVFIAGMSLSMLLPYSVFSTSKCVDESNSAIATSLVQAVAPGLGGFVSPLILTNLTAWLYPDAAQTPLRYQLIGFAALALGLLFYAGSRLRTKKPRGRTR